MIMLFKKDREHLALNAHGLVQLVLSSDLTDGCDSPHVSIIRGCFLYALPILPPLQSSIYARAIRNRFSQAQRQEKSLSAVASAHHMFPRKHLGFFQSTT